MNNDVIPVIPRRDYPEYHLTLCWRADRDGQGVFSYLFRIAPDMNEQILQASFHPGLNLMDALENALTNFFGPEV